jgi:hypothetical protein
MAFTAMSAVRPRRKYSVYEYFSCGEELKSIQLTSQQRKNIFLIFKEALYNVVKYAKLQERACCHYATKKMGWL